MIGLHTDDELSLCRPTPQVDSLGDVLEADHGADALQKVAPMRSFVQVRLSAQPFRPLVSRNLSWGCGPGRVSRVTSNCAVWRDSGPHDDGMSRTFSVVAQIDGDANYIGQSGRRCRLVAGALCLLDGDLSFQIEPAGAGYTHLVLSLPREPVLQRFPDLRSCTALLLDASEPGTVLYRQTMIQALQHIAALDAGQRVDTLEALLRLLGVLKPPRPVGTDGAVEAAFRFIEDHLHYQRLDADAVARQIGISRRRLDERFVRACGMPVAAHILERRMTEAAAALSDPGQRQRTVWNIAAGLGYTDAAHFARAFKRRHGTTATAWREAVAQASPVPGTTGDSVR